MVKARLVCLAVTLLGCIAVGTPDLRAMSIHQDLAPQPRGLLRPDGQRPRCSGTPIDRRCRPRSARRSHPIAEKTQPDRRGRKNSQQLTVTQFLRTSSNQKRPSGFW
jgi:hypothetical protein